MSGTALIAGMSGIVGNNLARHLVKGGWTVHGLALRPPADLAGFEPVVANLLDPILMVHDTDRCSADRLLFPREPLPLRGRLERQRRQIREPAGLSASKRL